IRPPGGRWFSRSPPSCRGAAHDQTYRYTHGTHALVGQRLVEKFEGRARDGCDVLSDGREPVAYLGHVVEAHHRYVSRYLEARVAQRCHDADRHLVGGGEDRRVGALAAG